MAKHDGIVMEIGFLLQRNEMYRQHASSYNLVLTF